jgi:hypothetical protein
LTGDLSFALKLNPQEATAAAAEDGQAPQQAEQRPSHANGSAPAIALKPATSEITALKDTHSAEADANSQQPSGQGEALARAVAAFQAAPPQAKPVSSADSNPPQQPVEAARSLDATAGAGAPAASDSVSATPAPLKNLSIQVGQSPQDRVELRVVERSGELQVAVRAANPDVAQGLRQGLSELVGRLEQNGFRAEAWRPGATVNTVQSTAGTPERSTQFQNNNGGQPQSGGSSQGRQQHNQQQSNRPQWVEELEGNLSGGGVSHTGESNGIRH